MTAPAWALVACPVCGAAVGHCCFVPGTQWPKGLRKVPHRARVKAADARSGADWTPEKA